MKKGYNCQFVLTANDLYSLCMCTFFAEHVIFPYSENKPLS